ncbi:E2 [Eidolon helvum papillomavirus 1]|uniref:Regulatory protein E2 n=1 Tax=Eidolon helvum papillomavirus 1 TaxID=1163701 RepID=S4TGZ5_9PAPI|nr:E2 [Eidolon helvum papillomavirus 1]AGB34178.1 E2 [Eidolon helvum papillomavirus 1]
METEKLAKRLSSLEEEILRHYEKDSKRLEDQIRFWNLMRREQALMHFIRKQGVHRVGLRPIPSLMASEAEAKKAIEMEVVLTSLSKSQFAFESWGLRDTSWELYKAPPENTLKKYGQQVELTYDNDPDNRSAETLWGGLYIMYENDDWRRVTSAVDEKGIYYVDPDGLRIYYVNFEALADRYGSTGAYKVMAGSDLIAVVGSDTDSEDTTAPDAPSIAARRVSSPQTPKPSPKKTPPRKPPRRRRVSTPTRRQRRGEPGSRNRRGARATAGCTRGECTPPSPSQVGRRHQSTPPKNLGRLGRLLAEAYDPPILVCRGAANTLKCLRYRVHLKHSNLYDTVSTTWNWTKGSYPQSRIIYLFNSKHQRESFLEHVKLPASVTHYTGFLNGI